MKATKNVKKAGRRHSSPHGGPKEAAISLSPSLAIAASDQSEVNSPVQTDSLFSMKQFNAEQDLPIVYNDNYNISMLGIELMHQFDTKKYGKLAEFLNSDFFDTPFARVLPRDKNSPTDGEDVRRLKYLSPNRPVSLRELCLHHTDEYINQVHESQSLLARITETWMLNMIPMSTIESRLLTPLKWQVAGTIFAFHLAIQHGWAINLGGGFHQSSAHDGNTFCIFSDILLSMKYVWRKHPLQKYMIIDLDAHQGTGLERDLCELSNKRRKQVFMLDLFNDSINPPDSRADQGINLRVALGRFTGDATYMKRLKKALEEAFAKFKPTLVIYVAGQDVLKGDQLGLMNLSDEAFFERDQLIFSWAAERQKCPIVMLLSGGYLTRGTKLHAESIRNLYAKNLIWGGHKSGSQRSLSRPRLQHKDTIEKGTASTSNTPEPRATHFKKLKPQTDSKGSHMESAGKVYKNESSVQDSSSLAAGSHPSGALAPSLPIASKKASDQANKSAKRHTAAATKKS